MATYLVTGVAGFIASKVAEMLLAEGHCVVGIDNLNDAYDVRLKHWRLERLKMKPNFTFHYLDICNRQDLCDLFSLNSVKESKFDAVINLAAGRFHLMPRRKRQPKYFVIPIIISMELT